MKRCSLILFSIAMLFCFAPPPVQAKTYAYIPSSGDGNVTRVSTDDEAIAAVAFGDDPYGAAVSPKGDTLVVTRPSADSITLVSTSDFTITGAQISIPVGDEPRGVAIESRGLYAYVTNYAADTVSEIYLPSSTVTDTISTGDGPWGVAATYDEVQETPKVYVANHLDGSISVISNDGVRTIDNIGNAPVGLALTPDGAYLYVALLDDDRVAIVQTSTNALVSSVPAGVEPWGVAVGSGGAYVYVTNSLDDTVTVIDAQSQSFLESYDVGFQPMGVACPKNGDFAYVVNQSGNSISKIDIDAKVVTVVGADRISGAFGLGAFIGGSPPAAPSDLSAVETGYDSIELSWIDNAGDESGFKIERRSDTETRFTQIATVGGDVTTYTDKGLTGDTTYLYRVRAYNEAADSDYTDSAGATTDKGRFSWCFIGTLFGPLF